VTDPDSSTPASRAGERSAQGLITSLIFSGRDFNSSAACMSVMNPYHTSWSQTAVQRSSVLVSRPKTGRCSGFYPRTAGVIDESEEASAFLETKYCSHFRYTDAADTCQVSCSDLARAVSGNSAKSSSRGFSVTLSLNSERSLVAAASKYPCGMLGHVSLSPRRNLLMSLRYSFNKVRVPYSGCPWKCTNKLSLFFFTNKSMPACADCTRTS